MIRSNYIALLLFFALGLGLHAQQDAQYTQYMYNTLAINPAYAGSRGVLSLSALYRSQWVGLDGAPVTQTININAPVSERLGLGLSIVNDEIGNGTNQNTYFDGVVSYTIPVSDSGKLSFGLKAGGHFFNIDFNQLRNYTDNGNVNIVNIDNKFEPNFGTGVYYHTPKFYAGLSIPNFLETEHFDNDDTTSFIATEKMSWYLISGYVFDLSADWQFKPTTLVRAVSGAPLQIDLSANFLFRNRLTLGAAHRMGAAWSGMVGFNVSREMLIGFAYDKESTELGNTAFNDGSVELFLRYEFFNKRKQPKSPRFF